MDRISMPQLSTPRIQAELFYAETVHNRIERLIEAATNKLNEGQSILVEFLLFDGQKVVPNYIGYQNPNFILVYGEDSSGNEITALLPHTNIQVLITILNKPTERKPIGFQGRE